MFTRSIGIGLLFLGFYAGQLTGFQELTRSEFAARLGELEKGATMDHVKAALGAPSHELTFSSSPAPRRPYAVGATGARAVWYYGAGGTSDFGALGQVFFDSGGDVTHTFGGGKPEDGLDSIDEAVVKECLWLIHTMYTANTIDWNPAKVVRIVNELHEFGQDTGICLIREYLRVSPPSNVDYEKVILLLRFLHEVPEDPGYFPRCRFGSTTTGPEDRSLLPRYPVHVLDGVPILMVTGYTSVGAFPLDLLETVEWYSKNCDWRKEALKGAPRTDAEIGDLKRDLRLLLEEYLNPVDSKIIGGFVDGQIDHLR